MRFLVYALLAVATVTATSIVKAELVDSIFLFPSSLIRKVETICEPDQTVPDDCNSCTCSQNGKSKICTQKVCFTNTTNNGTGSSFGNPNYIKVCDPGTYLMGKCNRCYCSDDGLTAWCEFGVCLPEIPANRSSASVEDSTKIYEPGEIYKSDCIQCKCLPDGYTLDCTPDSCIPAGRNHSIVETSESPLIFCQPGKSHRSNCNDCTCSANGTTASCTLKNCSSENHLRKRRQISGPSCYPNLQFKRGCQDCTCGFYGLECSMSCEDGGVPECLPNGFSKSVADTAEREVTIMRYSVYTEGYPQFWTVCSFPQPDKITFQPKLQQYQRWPEPEDC